MAVSALSVASWNSSSRVAIHASATIRFVAAAMSTSLASIPGHLVGLGLYPNAGMPSEERRCASRRRSPAAALSRRWSLVFDTRGEKRCPYLSQNVDRFSFGRGSSTGVSNDGAGENAEGDCLGNRRNGGDRVPSGSGVVSPSGEGTSGTSMTVVVLVPGLVAGTVTCEATAMLSVSSAGRLVATAATEAALTVRLGVRRRRLLVDMTGNCG